MPGWVSGPQTHSRVSISTLIFEKHIMEGDLYKYPLKIYHRRQSSCSRGDSIKGIVRAFSWLKCLGGFLHLKPTVGCQISTLIFEFSFVEGCLYEYPITNILRTAKFLSTGGFNQRYCPDLYLTEVPGWVSAPQANSRVSNINFDIWFFWRCGLYKYPMKNILRAAKFCPLGI